MKLGEKIEQRLTGRMAIYALATAAKPDAPAEDALAWQKRPDE